MTRGECLVRDTLKPHHRSLFVMAGKPGTGRRDAALRISGIPNAQTRACPRAGAREATVPDVTHSHQLVEAGMARKPSKAARRAHRYELRKHAARTGRQLLDAAIDLLLADLTTLKDLDPAKADNACRHLAAQIEAIAQDTAREVARADVTVH